MNLLLSAIPHCQQQECMHAYIIHWSTLLASHSALMAPSSCLFTTHCSQCKQQEQIQRSQCSCFLPQSLAKSKRANCSRKRFHKECGKKREQHFLASTETFVRPTCPQEKQHEQEKVSKLASLHVLPSPETVPCPYWSRPSSSSHHHLQGFSRRDRLLSYYLSTSSARQYR